MRSVKPHQRTVCLVSLGLAFAALAGAIGCISAPPMAVQAHRYRIEVVLDPKGHRLIGRTTMDLARVDDAPLPPNRAVSIELALHPALRITRIQAVGATVKRRFRQRATDEQTTTFAPAKHIVVLDHPAETLTLLVAYEGELWQDVAAGEAPGRIHNFQMRAHIGEEGIYLANGCWYPQPAGGDQAEPALAEFVLLAERVVGMELLAGAQRAPQLGEPTGRIAWRSPYPIEELVLVGGPHEIHHTTHRGIAINVHLKPSQARHAAGLFEAVRRNLDRYEPLIGPYPAREYAIVDNFFSSGFAFPAFTLLSSAVIEMGERAQTTHGYLDHEMLHSWWGNGIHVDPGDGNWCESLTSYATNYYGYVLDQEDQEARRKRRNYSHFLSRMAPEMDKPLGTFGRPDGCSRAIAYRKGAAVFHMLARKMGQENFWAAMRRFTEERVGRYASWDDIRLICEAQSGLPLERFIDQWVRRGGAPQLEIEQARYRSADGTLTIVLWQGEPAFELDVPVRITHKGGSLDLSVAMGTSSKRAVIPLNVVPLTVEVDPDYHLFRKIPLDEIIPTTRSTCSGTALATVLPGGEVPAPYRRAQAVFESTFAGNQHHALTADKLAQGVLAQRCVLILGESVRHPYVSAFLEAIEFPVRWTDDGFKFSGVRYEEPTDALLCTVRHPGVDGGGVTVLYGNSVSAIPNPDHLMMYDRSLVIFKDGRPTVQRDFERPRRVLVEQF